MNWAAGRAEAARPRPSSTGLCSDQLVLTKASMSTRVEVEDAFFCPSTLTSSLWLVVGLTALLKTTLRACALEEQAARRCPISGRAPQGRSGCAPGKGSIGVASSLPLSQPPSSLLLFSRILRHATRPRCPFAQRLFFTQFFRLSGRQV